MARGNTTQFFFVPDARPNNRKYVIALASGFWTFCLGCTLLSILAQILFSGSVLTILASPFVIAIALIPNVGIAFAIPRLQRYQRSHRYVLIGAFLAGAIIAIPPALVINTTLLLPIEASKSTTAEIVGSGTIAGIVEEGIKGLIVLFIFLRYRDEYHDLVDGVVIGALVGLGFAMTEDITYFLSGLAEGGPISLIITLFLRLGLGWMNHSVFTAITGAALGIARMGPPGNRRLLIPLLGYGLAASLHNTFNLLATLLGKLMPDGLVGLLLTIIPIYGLTWTAMAILGFVVLRGWHQQADLIRTELYDETRAGLLALPEYQALPAPGQRRMLLREAQRLGGQPVRSLLGKRFQLAIALALQKRHSHFGDRPGLPALHSELALRARLAELRVALAGLPLLQSLPLDHPPQPALAPPQPAPTPQPADTPALPAGLATATYRLVFLSGPTAGQRLILIDGLTIGRGANWANFTIPDPEVSSLHARISRDGGPPVLIDANSTNGTYVNDERITSRSLRPGDRIRFGPVQSIVEALGA